MSARGVIPVAVPCDRCGREVTIRYVHREDGDRLELCEECHPDPST